MKNLLKKIKERLSNESGFTMIELIIVIALIAIIGAMLVPSFTQTTTRSRIKTDINSAKTIQNACNTYNAEMATDLPTSAGAAFKTDVIDELVDAGFLDKGLEFQSVKIGDHLSYKDGVVSIIFKTSTGDLAKFAGYVSGLTDEDDVKNGTANLQGTGNIQWN